MKVIAQIAYLTIISLAFSSCASQNIMNYYYAMDDKVEVKVFKYINPSDVTLTEYWKVTTHPLKQTILTESFDSKFQLYNTFKEKVNKERAELLSYIEYEGELETKEIIAKVNKVQVYTSSETDPYIYAVEYINRYGRMTFEKERQFMDFENIVVQGITHRTAKFKDNYTIKAIDQNDKFNFSQITYYSLGIGMVKYERLIPTEDVRILELETILSEEEFETLKTKSSR